MVIVGRSEIRQGRRDSGEGLETPSPDLRQGLDFPIPSPSTCNSPLSPSSIHNETGRPAMTRLLSRTGKTTTEPLHCGRLGLPSFQTLMRLWLDSRKCGEILWCLPSPGRKSAQGRQAAVAAGRDVEDFRSWWPGPVALQRTPTQRDHTSCIPPSHAADNDAPRIENGQAAHHHEHGGAMPGLGGMMGERGGQGWKHGSSVHTTYRLLHLRRAASNIHPRAPMHRSMAC